MSAETFVVDKCPAEGQVFPGLTSML